MSKRNTAKTAATRTVSLDDAAALATFAADAVTVARAIVAAGQGYGRKAFICDVASALGADLATCKVFLLAAHKAGCLDLSRADLVEAMDPAKVAASDTWHTADRRFAADYNFVNAY